MDVVIVGAGFAGISAAKKLRKNKSINITIIDKNNYHLFQPLLYQVASAGLNPSNITYPIRQIFAKDKNVKTLMGEVHEISLKKKTVHVNSEEIKFDYLICGMGSQTTYYGNDEWRDETLGLKTIEEAITIRNALISSLEKHEFESSGALSIAIIGAGPTGTELAGSIAEFSRYTIDKNYKNFSTSNNKIYLIEKGDNILSTYDKKQADKAKLYLEKLGVDVIVNADIEELSKNEVKLKDKTLAVDFVIWAAGMEGIEIEDENLSSNKAKRYFCEDDLSQKEYPNVFILGDQSLSKDQDFPTVAPLAIQQGAHAAKNILNDIEGKKRSPFKYLDKGNLAVIGRSFAIADIRGLKFSGFPAWALWSLVHIIPLVGFRNRAMVMGELIWSYFNYKKGVRIITHLKK